MTSGFLPRGFDTKSSAMKEANAAGRSFTEYADARVDAAYVECLKIVRTAPSIEEAARRIEEVMNG